MDDGWISSNVPPADETPEPVYNRGQLHVRRESYWLLAVVQLLRRAHPLLVHHDSLLLSHAPVLPNSAQLVGLEEHSNMRLIRAESLKISILGLYLE